MWILVVGPEGLLEREDGAVSVLRDLGCNVKIATLWDSLSEPEMVDDPPAVVVVEDNVEKL